MKNWKYGGKIQKKANRVCSFIREFRGPEEICWFVELSLYDKTKRRDLFYLEIYAWNYIWMMRKRFYYLTHVESWTHNNIVWGLKNLCSRLHQYSGFFWGAIFFPFRTSNYLPHAKRAQKSPKVPSMYYVSTYRTRAIITRGLYIFKPHCSLRFIIKSGLY